MNFNQNMFEFPPFCFLRSTISHSSFPIVYQKTMKTNDFFNNDDIKKGFLHLILVAYIQHPPTWVTTNDVDTVIAIFHSLAFRIASHNFTRIKMTKTSKKYLQCSYYKRLKNGWHLNDLLYDSHSFFTHYHETEREPCVKQSIYFIL